ncbi:hypothetical protein Hdeb2414_s0005g00156541 [Helianthus debilis subsp. tardiflorus]
MAAYANAVLGEDNEDDIDVESVPAREEVLVLSSEGSDGSHEGLILHSSRAGPPQGTVNEPAVDDVETPVDTAEQLETRKTKKRDKTGEKKAGELVCGAPRKRPSNFSFLDYVLAICWRKCSSLVLVPELLVKLWYYVTTPKSGKGTRGVDISQITPPESPPSRTFDLSPPRSDLKGKGKEDDVEVEPVGIDVTAGAGGGEDFVEGDETNVESSEATPQQGTIYTNRVPGSRGGGASGTRKSPKFTHVQSGSWSTQNPGCDDLPHVPRWNLTQSSRMNDIANYRDFTACRSPPAERMFQ